MCEQNTAKVNLPGIPFGLVFAAEPGYHLLTVPRKTNDERAVRVEVQVCLRPAKERVDFHRVCREYTRQGYIENWEFSVLHLNTALELMLKAILATEGHYHLVAGKAQVTARQFDEGAFRNIGVEESLERLAKLGKLTLDSKQRQALEALQRLRNRIAHYIDPDDGRR